MASSVGGKSSRERPAGTGKKREGAGDQTTREGRRRPLATKSSSSSSSSSQPLSTPSASSASASSSRRGRTFSVGGNNGVSLIVAALERHNWRRIEDINATLRWAEVRRDLDFAAFRPGKQLMCRNPGAGAMGSKLRLLENLRLYCTARKLQLKRFFPETYKLDDVRERKLFFEVAEAESGSVPGPSTGAAEGKTPRWICKPTGLNQGKGIFLVDNLASFKRELSLADAAPKDGGLKR